MATSSWLPKNGTPTNVAKWPRGLYDLSIQHRLPWLVIFLSIVVAIIPISTQSQQSLASQPIQASTKYEIYREDFLQSPSSAFVSMDFGNEIYLISKAKRSQLGKALPKGSTHDNYRLYKVTKRKFDWNNPRIKRIPSHFGDELLSVGYTADESKHLALITEAIPLNASPQLGEKGFTNVAKITAITGVSPEALPDFNNVINPRGYYKSCQPALHPNGKMFVFVSNRPPFSDTTNPFDPKTIGGLNLFYSIKEGDLWSVPEPFDSMINSLGDEILPSFTSEGELYFASNGRGGFGNHDIFKAELDIDKIYGKAADGKWKRAIHLPQGINSPADDFGAVWNQDRGGNRQSGYFSSNRSNGKEVEIFRFQLRSPDLIGSVVSTQDAVPIPFADLVLLTPDNHRQYFQTDSLGLFSIPIKPSQNFKLAVAAQRYARHDTLHFDTYYLGQGKDKNLDPIALVPISKKQFTVEGTIENPDGMPIHDDPNVLICCDQQTPKNTIVTSKSQSFQVTMPVTGSYYLDVSLSDGSKNTWHFVPDKTQHHDTIQLPMVLTPLIDSIAVFKTAYAQPSSTQERPVANLVWYNTSTGQPKLIGHEQGDSTGRLRIAIPTSRMAPCTLVVAQKGFVPEVYNLARESAPEEIQLTSLQDLRFHPITIFHPYNMSIQDTSIISARNLERIAQLMLFDSSAVLQVISFTDSRGSNFYNDKLSALRASYVANYILSRTGIPSERLKPEGLGERNLLNDCDDSHPCPEELHRINRRTEITLYSIESSQ